MNAELIAVGSELVGMGRRDTNSEWLAERLGRAGFAVTIKTAVDDDAERIATLVRQALDRSPIVISTGGLGPTEDDRTREALALALDRELGEDPAMALALRERYAALGLSCGADRLRQALRPAGSEWLENSIGSAAGLLVTTAGSTLFALPGVPAEMREMFLAVVGPRLASFPTGGCVRRSLKIAGRTESSVDGRLRDLYDGPGQEVTLLTAEDGLELHVAVREADPGRARARIEALEASVRRRLGDDVYGADDQTLAGAVGALLRASGRTLACAESCTAGLLCARVTSVAGASAWFRGGVIVYDDALKRQLIGVRAETLSEHGAVSEAVALELAGGVRSRCGADIGVGITGIAGPSGGTEDKPVGRVHVAVADGAETRHRRLSLVGDRELIRGRSASIALDEVRRHLLGSE